MVVGETAAEARDKRALLDSVGHLGSGIASLSIAQPQSLGLRPAAPREPPLREAKRLVEALVFDLPFRALAFAQFRGALFFAASETNPIFLRLGLGLGAPTLLAVLIEVDDHRL
jgi:hypothetical protein